MEPARPERVRNGLAQDWFTGTQDWFRVPGLLARVEARLLDPVIPIVTRFFVKTTKSSKSLQLPHSIPKINYAKVSSRWQ